MTEKALQAAATVLRARGWFAEQPAALQQLILRDATVLRLPAGKTVYRHGDAPNGLFGLAAGRIKFSYGLRNGREVLSGFVAAGSWFGEVSMFDGLPRHHTAEIVSDAMLLKVSSEQFNAIVLHQAGFASNFATILCLNLRQMLIYLDEIILQPPLTRLARLLSLMTQSDVKLGHERDIVIEISQAQLASMIGLSRQSVNQLLGDLKSRGVIEIKYGAVIVLSAAKLQQELR